MSQIYISREEAYEILEPYLDTIYGWIKGGLDEYFTQFGPYSLKLEKRTRCSIIRDLIYDKAKCDIAPAMKTLDGESKLGLRDHGNLKLITIDRKINIRFKKLDEQFLGSNISTKQIERYTSQTELELNAGTIANLDAGYQWNILGTEIEGIWIVCPINEGRSVAWKMRLDKQEQSLNLFVPKPEITPEPRKRRVSIKEGIKKDLYDKAE